jgi:hypothetical protein
MHKAPVRMNSGLLLALCFISWPLALTPVFDPFQVLRLNTTFHSFSAQLSTPAMFARPLACAFLLLAGATAQIDTVPVLVSSVLETGPVSVSSAQDTAPVTVSSAQDTAPVSSADGFMTVQTSVPSSLATDSESTSACLEVCVVEPCTQCVHSRQASPASLLTRNRPFDEPAPHHRNDPSAHILRWRLHKHAVRIGNRADVDTAGRDTGAYFQRRRHVHSC